MTSQNNSLIPTNPTTQSHTTGAFFRDLSKLRMPSSFDGNPPSDEVFATVPVRKPGSHEFVRVSADPSTELDTTVYFDKDDHDRCYLVMPTLREALVDDIQLVTLRLAITLQSACFLWPLKRLPQGRRFGWFDTATEAARHAESRWVKIKADMSLQGYRFYAARGEQPEPVWPRKSFEELLDIAFRDQCIDSEEHPIVRKIWGI